MRHTDGPWVSDLGGVRSVYCHEIVPSGVVCGQTLDERLANLRLIAAAPDLLAACERLIAAHQETGEERDNAMQIAFRAARCAITQALEQ